MPLASMKPVASMGCTERLPNEVWHEIAGYLLDVKDLVSLAFACRQLQSIVVPHYLAFRRISSSITNSPLWEELPSNRRKCRSVEELYIRTPTTDESEHDKLCNIPAQRLIDGTHWTEDVLNSKQTTCSDADEGYAYPWAVLVANALVAIQPLRKLTLCITTCEIAILDGVDFFAKISQVEDLELHLHHCTECYDEGDHVEPDLSGLGHLPGNYRRFSLNAPFSESQVTADVFEHVMPVLTEDCPDLEALELHVAPEDATDFTPRPCEELWEGKWRRLKRISLHGVVPVSDDANSEAPYEFWGDLDSLEELRATAMGTGNSMPCIKIGLPLLRVLDTDDLGTASGLAGPREEFPRGKSKNYRKIETLTLRLQSSNISTNYYACETMEQIVHDYRQAGTLRKLTYIAQGEGGYQREHNLCLSMLGHIPTITHLMVQPTLIHHCDISHWQRTLERFGSLETLRSVTKDKFIGTFSPFPYLATREILSKDDFFRHHIEGLLEVCPKLAEIDDWVSVKGAGGRLWKLRGIGEVGLQGVGHFQDMGALNQEIREPSKHEGAHQYEAERVYQNLQAYVQLSN